MKRKRKKTTAIALVCGLVCAACVVLYTQSVRGEAEAARAEALARYGGEQLEVCVAVRDIAAGEPIGEGDVEMRLWVADLLPADAARAKDEVVVLKRFEGSGASLDVPDGLAALSVPAEDVQAVGGSLSAGATADLYSIGGTSTALLAEEVLILATSATGSEGASADLTWVTVAVEPESVQEIIDSSQRAKLYFVLPAAGDGLESAPDAVEPATDETTGEEGLQ